MRSLVAIVGIFAAAAAGANTVSNKVVFVDELGRNNAPEVIATVAQQTTNETMVIVAAAKAESANNAATTATNVVADVAAAITKNEVVIFRKGSMASFAPLVIFTEDDTITICEFTLDSENDEIEIGYVSTVNWGVMKPTIRASNVLVEKEDFGELPTTDVSAVTVHNEERTFEGQTYSLWYSVRIPKPTDEECFYYIGMNPDTPQGDGLTLEVKNGFTGGVTGVYVDGSLRKVYRGGILIDCQEIE